MRDCCDEDGDDELEVSDLLILRRWSLENKVSRICFRERFPSLEVDILGRRCEKE
jgi:hypothetical protein